MTTRSIVTVIAGVLVVAAGAYHLARPSPATPPRASKAPEAANTLPDATERVASDPVTQDNDTPPAPADKEASQTLTAYQPGVGMVEYEMIDGRRVKKNRNCEYKIGNYFKGPDGILSPAYLCVPNEPPPVDIYTTYSTETLKTLAYSDAHAAHVLTRRFRERDFTQAMKYAIRSAALADDPLSVQWLLNLYPTPTYKNNQAQLHVIEENYVLSGVFYALGGSGRRHLRWSELAKEHAHLGINREALDARIASLMNTVETIRSEVGIE